MLSYNKAVDSRQYLVQEFIQGETLQQELDNRGIFNESQIRELLIDLLSVLQFVHNNNLIHRDIKPENIMRRETDKKLVLVDFGASKIMPKTQRRTVTGTVIGSAEYCAPEQSMGKAKLASDLYSLGVVCLHLLTRMSPFDLSQKLYPVSCIHFVKLKKKSVTRISLHFSNNFDILLL